MIFAALIIVVLILFCNGLMILGIFGGRQMAWLNIAAGVTVTIMGLYLAFADPLKDFGPTQSFTASATCFAFAFTYFLLAGEIFSETDFKATGWYCFIVGCIMIPIGLGFFHILGSTLPESSQFGVFWLLWASLFWVFWACWGLGMSHLVTFAGYYTLFVIFATCLYPAIAFFNFGRIGW